MTGPANAVMGDDLGVEIPQTVIQEQDLTEERNAARFSRTKEFQRLKAHLEARIAHYQTELPTGEAVLSKSVTELAQEWKVANLVIAEFKLVLDAYERAGEVVANADKRAA